jgi:hypothetical protein
MEAMSYYISITTPNDGDHIYADCPYLPVEGQELMLSIGDARDNKILDLVVQKIKWYGNPHKLSAQVVCVEMRR